jgi:hypothetical protein
LFTRQLYYLTGCDSYQIKTVHRLFCWF